MPLVESSYTIQITLQDADGNRSPFTSYVGGNALFADVEQRANNLEGQLATLSGCAVVESSITKRFTETGPLVFLAGSEVETKGRFGFDLSDTRNHSVSVPGIRPTLVFPGTNQINRADANVAAFIALLLTGGTDSVGTAIAKLNTAIETSTTGPKRR